MLFTYILLKCFYYFWDRMIALITHDYSSLLANENQKSSVRTNPHWKSFQLLSHTKGQSHISSSSSRRVEIREVQTGSKEKHSAHRNSLVLEQVALRPCSLSPTDVSRLDPAKCWVTWSGLRSNPCFEQKVGSGNPAVRSNPNYLLP